jgi:hypothetical protein
MIIPIFVTCDDLPEIDFDGFGKFFIAFIICCIGMIPLTYSIFGVLFGFHVWGIYWVSAFIGFLGSIPITIICDIIVDKFNKE